MFKKAGVEEPIAPRIRRFPKLNHSIVILASALSLYLMLAMLTWAAPSSDQSDSSLKMRWLNSSSATTEAQLPGTSRIYLPMMYRQATPTPPPTPTPVPFQPIPGAYYESIQVDPYYYPDRVDSQHADLNLDLRGYEVTNQTLGLVNYSGYTDSDPPRLADLFRPARVPAFLEVYRVYNWNWSAPPNPGSRGTLIDGVYQRVTLVRMAASTNELIYLPTRSQDIYQSRLHAQVLYATENQITFVYTRDGNVIRGYTVHIENIWVDPLLVQAYQICNAGGRHYLPALANGQAFGRAKAGGILVAIRDNGNFMDPRSRKDWWQGW
jgi:hypothetical protein